MHQAARLPGPDRSVVHEDLFRLRRVKHLFALGISLDENGEDAPKLLFATGHKVHPVSIGTQSRRTKARESGTLPDFRKRYLSFANRSASRSQRKRLHRAGSDAILDNRSCFGDAKQENTPFLNLSIVQTFPLQTKYIASAIQFDLASIGQFGKNQAVQVCLPSLQSENPGLLVGRPERRSSRWRSVVRSQSRLNITPGTIPAGYPFSPLPIPEAPFGSS